jgi:hypothetical protein
MRILFGKKIRIGHIRTCLLKTYVYIEFMVLTASKLRENIYRILDHALETGEVIEIERNGRRLRIVPDEPLSRIDRLVHRPEVVIGDSEDFVHHDWSAEWKP